ncbi:MAG: GNAT family N-acetyltransferase [Alphaproteobacteria bacterium]
MRTLAQKNDYRCCLLEEADWQALRSARLELRLGENIAFEDSAKDAQEAGNERYWKNLLKSPTRYFVLYHGKTVAGLTEAGRKDRKLAFNNSYVFRKFRGLHLGDLLYEARLNYALQQTRCRSASTTISERNVNSRKAAERNGFQSAGVIPEDDRFLRYTFDLAAARRRGQEKDVLRPSRRKPLHVVRNRVPG